MGMGEGMKGKERSDWERKADGTRQECDTGAEEETESHR